MRASGVIVVMVVSLPGEIEKSTEIVKSSKYAA